MSNCLIQYIFAENTHENVNIAKLNTVILYKNSALVNELFETPQQLKRVFLAVSFVCNRKSQGLHLFGRGSENYRFEMNAHKPFSIFGYSVQNELGFQRDGKFLWLWVSNRGESALLAEDSKGDTLPWQWFPRAAALPWREASNGGQRLPRQEESNETGGFVAHDFVRKV